MASVAPPMRSSSSESDVDSTRLSAVFPPGFATFAGSTFHHAFVVLDANLQLPFVSEPSGLKLF